MAPSCYFIATSYGDAAVPQQFLALSTELAERGHRIVLLLDGQKKDAESQGTNPVIYTWPSKRPTRLQDALFLRKLINRYKPDCFVANFGASNVMMLVGWILRVACRVDWYHTLSSQIDTAIPAWRLRLLRLRKKFIYKAATHMVPVSKAAREDLRLSFGVPESKCKLFYNSLADPFAHVNSWVRTTNGFSNSVVCVGRLYPTKGQDVLIRAIGLLRHDFPRPIDVQFIGGAHRKTSMLNLLGG